MISNVEIEVFARAHYDALKSSGFLLNDRERIVRKMLSIWDAEATAEVRRLQIEQSERIERARKERDDRARANGPDYDAPGVFVE